MVNWDELIRSTPAMLRAAVIIVLLGLIVMATTVMSVVALTKGGFELGPGGLKMEAYKPPEVQNCNSLKEALPVVTASNENSLVSIDALLNSHTTTLEAKRLRRFEIGMEVASGRSQYNDALKDLVADIKSTEEKTKMYDAQRTQALDTRLAMVHAIETTCKVVK